MAFSDQEKQRILQQAFGPKTQLVCSKHFYSPGGPKMPTDGCTSCWMAFLLHHVALLPPHKRQEKMDELEMVLRTSCELEDKGTFDFKPYRHPQITIEKGKEN